MAEINYNKEKLEDRLQKYLEQRALLIQSLERIEGGIITLRDLINPKEEVKPTKTKTKK